MAAGRPQADLQWRKSGITFTWQPMVNLTDNSLKIEDTDARITACLKNGREEMTKKC